MMAGSFDIFKGALKDNKGKVVIAAGKTLQADRPRAREDELPGRRRRSARSELSTLPRLAMRNALDEAVRCRCGALAAALLLFGVFVWFGGVSPVEVWTHALQGRVRRLVLVAEHAAARRAADAHGAVRGDAGARRAGRSSAAKARSCSAASACGGAAVRAAACPATSSAPRWCCLAGALVGGAWIALAGGCASTAASTRRSRSLLLAYIAIALFKHLRRRAAARSGEPEQAVDAPLGEGAAHRRHRAAPTCTGAWCSASSPASRSALLARAAPPRGFAVRVVGGNPRAAQLVGLPASRLIVLACALGGACAGLAGAVEVAAVHTNANASLIAGYGYAGILVAFIARHNPLAIIPVAILFGGFGAAGSLLQRRLGLPDASVLVLQGIAFVLILASEALRGSTGRRCCGSRMPRRPPSRRCAEERAHDRATSGSRCVAGIVGGALARRRALPLRQPRRVPHREVGPHQPRPRRRAGARRRWPASAAPT